MNHFRALYLVIVAMSLTSLSATAQPFVIWNNPNTSQPHSATGILTDGSHIITVTLTTDVVDPINLGDDRVLDPDSSSRPNSTPFLNTAFGGVLPGTNDFIVTVNGTDFSTWTLSFSQAVVNPKFYVRGMDFRGYSFLDGVKPVLLPDTVNMIASGATVGDTDPSSFDNGFGDPMLGTSSGSAYGGFQIPGIFTEIRWSRPLGPGGFVTDGNALAVAAVAAPEPGTASLTVFGLFMSAFVCRRRNVKS